MKRLGIHVIADLHLCDLRSLVESERDVERVKRYVSEVIHRYRFTELGSVYHFFGPHAITATVCLAESHFTFHTWPEEGYVSLDLFACNRRVNRSEEAVELCAEVARDLFKAGEIIQTIVDR
jgi:S-adenosylmethionine decarboxylase